MAVFLVLLMPKEHRVRRGLTILAEVIGLGYQEEARLLLNNEGKKECFPRG